jgi:hypothetical protein
VTSPPHPDGGHVFLSYAAEDREVARALTDALVKKGYTVWWDRLIDAGTEWDREIQRALSEAVAVVVLWSRASVDSHYVRAEARHAAQRRALVPVMIDACEPPMPFGEFQSIDLTSWRDGGDDAVIAAIVGAIERIQSGRPPETSHHRWSDRASQRVWQPIGIVVRYFADLFEFATGPKTFLLSRWPAPGFLAASGMFFAASLVLVFLIELPLWMKIGARASSEALATFMFGPIRMLVVGVIVHAAWRLVGGVEPALKTLGAVAYMYSLTAILYGFFQIITVGLLRALAPEAARTIFSSMFEGRPEQGIIGAIEGYGLVPAAAFLALFFWPVIGVPFVCWGAFRIRNHASRTQSGIAATVTLVLGVLASGLAVFMAFASVGPG